MAIRPREIREPFLGNRPAFAATFLLRQTASGDSEQDSMTVLELYDPLRMSSFISGERSLPLTHDSSAPIARVRLHSIYGTSLTVHGLVNGQTYSSRFSHIRLSWQKRRKCLPFELRFHRFY